MIQLSELYAKSNGWTTQRHKNYPTTDIPVYKLLQDPDSWPLLFELLQRQKSSWRQQMKARTTTTRHPDYQLA